MEPVAVYGWEYYAKTDVPWTQDIRAEEAIYRFPPLEVAGQVACFECFATGWNADDIAKCNVCKGTGRVWVGLF